MFQVTASRFLSSWDGFFFVVQGVRPCPVHGVYPMSKGGKKNLRSKKQIQFSNLLKPMYQQYPSPLLSSLAHLWRPTELFGSGPGSG